MSGPGQKMIIGALYSFIALALLAGGDKKDDANSTAEHADKKASIRFGETYRSRPPFHTYIFGY